MRAAPARAWRCIAWLVLAGLPASWLYAQVPEAPRPQVRAFASASLVHLDGRLDEVVWSLAAPATDFVQRQPHPGDAPSERTEVRILRDRGTLYIGVRAYDSDAGAIIAQEMRVDGGGGGGFTFGGAGGAFANDDSVAIVLDTFLDRRNAFYFETNATGARADGLVENEAAVSFEWDGVWEAAGHRDEEGWSVEIAIPFSTLRFDTGSDVWGLQIRRLIRRKNEEVYWSPVGLDADLSRVSRAGNLLGMDSLQRSVNLRIKPFGSASNSQDLGSGESATSKVTGGLDLLRWGVTGNMTLDLTANTDFAQVEADEQQVNLTRFSLFFPEKREFFLENSGIFEFGAPLPAGAAMRPPLFKAFFSRNIGLDEGRVVPLNAGGRFTGRAGGWSFGAMDVQTGELDATEPDEFDVAPTNWGVMRVKRNVGERSTVGAIFTNKQVSGGDWNRLLGLDADINPSRRAKITGYLATTRDAGAGSTEWSGGAGFAWRGSLWRVTSDFEEISDGFNPEMGFLLRQGVRRAYQSVEFEPRPDLGKAIRNLSFNVRTEGVWRTSGELDTADITVRALGVDFASGERVTIFGNYAYERLDEPFEIQPGIFVPPGEYDWADYGIFVRTDGARPVSGFVFGTYGNFYDGKRLMGELDLTLRPSRFFSASTSWSYNDVDLPYGDFTVNVVRQRVDVAFSPDLFWNTYVQYNSADELMSLNSRFNWIYRPGMDIFLVYNQEWQTGDGLLPADRAIILKATYLFFF